MTCCAYASAVADSPMFLAAHRKGAKLSVPELAKRAGVAKTTVYRIEAGDVKGVEWNTLRQLAAVFGIAPGALFFAPGDPCGAAKPAE